MDWAPLIDQAFADLKGKIASLPWDDVWTKVGDFWDAFKTQSLKIGETFTTWLQEWVTGRVNAIKWDQVWAGMPPPPLSPQPPSPAGVTVPPGAGGAPGLQFGTPQEARPGFGIGIWFAKNISDGIVWALQQYDALDKINQQMNKDADEGKLTPLGDAFNMFLEDILAGLFKPELWKKVRDQWDETWTTIFAQATPFIKRQTESMYQGGIHDPLSDSARGDITITDDFCELGQRADAGILGGIKQDWKLIERAFNDLIRSMKPDPLKVPVQFVDDKGNPISAMPSPLVPVRPLRTPPQAQYGADWLVGGTGGTDSALVQFRATPGERVIVQTPGQQAAGGSNVIVHMPITIQGNADQSTVERFRQVVREELNGMVSGNRRGQPRLELGHTRI
jgi:hypothetical protein